MRAVEGQVGRRTGASPGRHQEKRGKAWDLRGGCLGLEAVEEGPTLRGRQGGALGEKGAEGRGEDTKEARKGVMGVNAEHEWDTRTFCFPRCKKNFIEPFGLSKQKKKREQNSRSPMD